MAQTKERFLSFPYNSLGWFWWWQWWGSGSGVESFHIVVQELKPDQGSGILNTWLMVALGYAIFTHGSDREFNGPGLEIVLIALYSLERTLSHGHT